jgi:hypothetical protein
MNTNLALRLASCTVVFSLLACGPSDQQLKRLTKVGDEIVAIQLEYYPAIADLGKAAREIDSLSRWQDSRTKAVAAQIATAQQLITEAFAACQKAQDAAVVGSVYKSGEKYILAEEQFKELLKVALEKTKAAISESQALLTRIADAKAGKHARNK